MTPIQSLGFGLTLFMVGWAIEFHNGWRLMERVAARDCVCIRSRLSLFAIGIRGSVVLYASLLALATAPWPYLVIRRAIQRFKRPPRCEFCGMILASGKK